MVRGHAQGKDRREDEEDLAAGPAATAATATLALRHRRKGYFDSGAGQTCVSPLEWFWTIPSSSIELGITKVLSSPGST